MMTSENLRAMLERSGTGAVHVDGNIQVHGDLTGINILHILDENERLRATLTAIENVLHLAGLSIGD